MLGVIPWLPLPTGAGAGTRGSSPFPKSPTAGKGTHRCLDVTGTGTMRAGAAELEGTGPNGDGHPPYGDGHRGPPKPELVWVSGATMSGLPGSVLGQGQG